MLIVKRNEYKHVVYTYVYLAKYKKKKVTERAAQQQCELWYHSVC